MNNYWAAKKTNVIYGARFIKSNRSEKEVLIDGQEEANG